jgi:hypothetical protein
VNSTHRTVALCAALFFSASGAIAGGSDDPALQAAFLEARYGIERSAEDLATWQTVNPAQHMRGTFDCDGAEVRSADARLRLALVAYGRPGALQPVASAQLAADGRRIELRRGAVTEWYVNDPRGLEQGFTLHAPPARSGAGALALQLEVGGGLVPELQANARGVQMLAADGSTGFVYSGLAAWDADGRDLEAWISTDAATLTLHVRDEGASWPVTVDPWIVTQEALLQPSVLAAGDRLGQSVAFDGDTALLGAYRTEPNNAGTAYVFVRSGTTWTEQARLTGLDTSAVDRFGSAVALSGDTAVVGAPGATGVAAGAGAAYVFVRSGTTWSQQSKLVDSSGLVNDKFGDSVAVDADTAAVGASGAPTAHVYLRTGTVWSLQGTFGSATKSVAVDGDRFAYAGSGGARIYLRTGTTWTYEDGVSPFPNPPEASFGARIDLDGDRLAVGAPTEKSSSTLKGAAYVFLRSGTEWSQDARIEATDGVSGDYFGDAVSISGDTLAVGAPRHFFPSPAGAVYVYTRTGTSWSEDAKLVSTTGGVYFGQGVALQGTRLVVGAPESSPQGSFSGQGEVYEGAGASWTQEATLVHSAPYQTRSGASVALSGMLAVVGAPDDDVAGVDAGAAHLFSRSGTVWTEVTKLIASDAAAGDAFGTSVSIAGSLLIVGAPEGQGVAPGTGAVYAYTQSGTTWVQQAKLTAPDSGPGDRFGTSVSLSGTTALIGAEGDDDFDTDMGAAYVYTQGGGAWSQQTKLIPGDPHPGKLFGGAVAIEGVYCVVGAPGDPVQGLDAGAAYAFAQSGTTWTQEAKLVRSGGAAGDRTGSSVGIGGQRVIVGSPLDDNAGGVDAGAAYIFSRTGGGWPQAGILRASDGEPGAEFGSAVDLEGATATVGARLHDGIVVDRGAVYVYVKTPLWTEQAKFSGAARCGSSIAMESGTVLAGAPDGYSSGGTFVLLIAPDGPLSYCTAGTSFAGCQALISASGTPSATLPSGFVLSVTGAEGQKNGIFFYGSNGRQANSWGNGTSYQCVVPPVKRGGLLPGFGTAFTCDGFYNQDLNAHWCPGCPKPNHNPGVGAVVQAQLWYRDPQNTSNQTTGLSDAIEFWMAP